MKNKLAETIQLSLYGRPDCHLCEDMQAGLQGYAERFGFVVDIIDIDKDPALLSQFGSKVPVLMHGSHEICHYFLDPQALQMYFSESLE